MVKLYYDLIKKDLWSIEKVSVTWRNEVQALLDTDEV